MKLYIVALLALFLALFVVSVQTAEAEKEDTASELKKPAEEAPAPAKLPTPPAAAAGEKKEGERLEEGAKKGGKSRSSNKRKSIFIFYFLKNIIILL